MADSATAPAPALPGKQDEDGLLWAQRGQTPLQRMCNNEPVVAIATMFLIVLVFAAWAPPLVQNDEGDLQWVMVFVYGVLAGVLVLAVPRLFRLVLNSRKASHASED